MKKVFFNLFTVFLLSFIILTSSCKKDPAIPDKKTVDYFPLKLNTQKTYKVYHYQPWDSAFWGVGAVVYNINKDTLIAGKTYTINSYSDDLSIQRKYIRKENGNYMYINALGEFTFLKNYLPVASTWVNNGIRFTIESKAAVKTIQGVNYKNIIEVKAQGINDSYSTRHFYAEGVGEINGFYPVPTGFTFLNEEWELLPQ